MKTDTNPFESPRDAATKSQENTFRLRNWLVELLMLSEPIMLVVLAFAHRCQLESHPTYGQSPLIKLEVAGLLLAFLVVLVALVRAFSFLMAGEKQQAAVNGVVAFLTVGLSVVAMLVDAPTLVYAT
jgi:hypothetical protein